MGPILALVCLVLAFWGYVLVDVQHAIFWAIVALVMLEMDKLQDRK